MAKSDEPSLASFGKDFQEKLAKLILDDVIFADQISEVIDISFFELKYLQVFVETIFKHKAEYGCFPNHSTLETVLRTELERQNPVVQKQVRDFFARVLSGTIEDIEDDYVKDKSLDFCKKQKLKEAMIKSVGLMERSSFDEVSKVINQALKLGLDNDNGYEFMKHFEERYKFKARDPVSTGWEIIDNYIQGGHGRGELGVVVAPTGAGKSMLLVHLAAQAMKQGKNVVYYTLELGDTVIGRRFDSCLTGIPLKGLSLLKDEVFEKVRQIPGKLIIKEYPTKSASTESIKNHLLKLQQRDFKVDMIVVDYGDLLKPVTAQREKRNELEGIYEELRGIAAEFKCPLWTASQTNRCFSKNTIIYTLQEDGSVKLQNVDTLKPGDKVETAYGYKEIVDTNTSRQKTYTITLKNGKHITVSSKHQFPTKNGLQSIDTGLKVGDTLLTRK